MTIYINIVLKANVEILEIIIFTFNPQNCTFIIIHFTLHAAVDNFVLVIILANALKISRKAMH